MSGDITTVLAAVMCGTAVVVGEPITIPLLRRAAIDVPGDRSSHTVPTPRGGGAPVAAGLLLAAALVGGATATAFAIAIAGFGLIGLGDDLRGLPVGGRLAMQTAASAAAGALLVGHLAMPTAVLVGLAVSIAAWVIGFVNAFNFMDGVNGISGAHAFVGGIVYACLGRWRPDEFLGPAGVAVAVGALAFLPWNFGRARVFLGDVGSYALGAALAVLAAYAVLGGIPAEAALGPLALYIADTAWTLQRRIRAGERWLEAHRTHVYQQWCDAGWSHQRVTAIATATTALLSLLGAASLTGHPTLRLVADVTAAGVLITYLRSPVLLMRRAAAQAEA